MFAKTNWFGIVVVIILLTAVTVQIGITKEQSYTTLHFSINPCAVGVNSENGEVYLPSNVGIHVIGANNQNITTIPSTKSSCRLAVDPIANRIYVIDGEKESLYVINGLKEKITNQLYLKAHPVDIAVNKLNHILYVAFMTRNQSGIFVVNGSSNQIIDSIGGIGKVIRGITLNPYTNRVYALAWNSNGSLLVTIDGNSNAILNSIKIPEASQSIGIDPNRNVILVNSFDQNLTDIFYVLNASSDTISKNITLFGGVNSSNTAVNKGTWGLPSHIVINSINDAIYIPNTLLNKIYVLDRSYNIAKSLDVDHPLDVDINSNGNKIYVVGNTGLTIFKTSPEVSEFDTKYVIVGLAVGSVVITSWLVKRRGRKHVIPHTSQ